MFQLLFASLSLALLALPLGSAAPLTLPRRLSSPGLGAALATRQDAPSPTAIQFYTCPSDGNVSAATIQPCEGGSGSTADPCVFTEGRNYTITLTFTPSVGATAPRANLIAYDKTEMYGEDHYPYSGQSFNGCEYTPCPIAADTQATYTYDFHTLASQFDRLTFNLTSSLTGPSILCAGFPVTFVPSQ